MSRSVRGRATRWSHGAVAPRVALLCWAALTVGFVAQCTPASPVVLRVNVGGPAVSAASGPAWSADTTASPSPYAQSASTGSNVLSTARAVSSGTTGAPAAVFRDVRRVTAPSQAWSLPGGPGEYQVNLYFAEIGSLTQGVGHRTFGVWLEGGQVEHRFDVYAAAGGGDRGVVRSHQVTVFDDRIDLTLTRAASDPILSAIEVVKIDLPGRWHELPETPIARGEASFVQLAGRFYLAGGMAGGVPLADQSVYDPVAGSWRRLAPLPEPLHHVQAVAHRGRIYYLGGLYGFPGPWSDHVYIYDPLTDTFSEGARMPRGRGAGGVAVHDGRIYYAGGLRGTEPVPWFDAYDPETDTWRQLPDLPTGKDHFHAAVVGDRLYAIAGRRHLAGSVLTENVAYDFSAGRWITGLRPIPTARGGFAAVRLGGEVVVIGGEIRTPNVAFRSALAYDPATDTWRSLAPMGMTQHGIEAAVCGDDVYVASGDSAIGNTAPTRVHAAFSLDGTIDRCLPLAVPTTTTTTTTTTEPETTTTTEPETTTTTSTTTTEPETTSTSTTTTEPETTTTTTSEPDTTTTTVEG